MSNDWESSLCGCCGVKDCGVGCCIKVYCCGLCIYGSAMEKAALGSCFGSACCKHLPPPARLRTASPRGLSSFSARARAVLYCCSCLALPTARVDVAKKYDIDESCFMSWFFGCCCGCCSYFQIVNQILVKENATWGCGGVVGAPEVAVMER